MVVVVRVESSVAAVPVAVWSVELFDPQAANSSKLETGTANVTKRKGVVITEAS
jgi:hypothetical protein